MCVCVVSQCYKFYSLSVYIFDAFLLQKQVKGAVTIAMTVGVPWIVAILSFEPIAAIGQWAFIILTGLQVIRATVYHA